METAYNINNTISPGATNNINTRKKILFACIPGDGHFNPLVPLAVHLKNLGHDVRWYTSAIFSDKLVKLDIKHYEFKKALDINAENIDALLPGRKKIKNKIKRLSFDLIQGFILRSTEYFEDIQQIQNTFSFDVVVADCMFMAMPFIKHKLNVPVISIGVVPLIESSKDIAPPGLGLTPSNNFWGRIKQDVLRFTTSKILLTKPSSIMRKLLKERGIIMREASAFDFISHEANLLLQIGVPGFEYTRSDLSNNVRFIGALSNTSNNKIWKHPKLAQYNKMILVTQGTVEKDVSKLIIPTLEAFKNSKYLVVVTTGGSHTEELRNQFNYPNIIIEDFIPFNEIMPLANVYITNGGYGGVMLSIMNKLPMVVAGVHEGKSEINARVGYFKIGVNLHTEKPTAAKLKAGVSEVLQESIYKRNIENLSNEVSQYNSNELCTAYIDEVLKLTSFTKHFNHLKF
jgi:MGT family glycosyltransferase